MSRAGKNCSHVCSGKADGIFGPFQGLLVYVSLKIELIVMQVINDLGVVQFVKFERRLH